MLADQELFIRVAQKLTFDPRIDSSNIMIAVKDGIITLTGTVSTYAAKLMAEDDVKSIKGVKGIAEELKVNFNSLQRERTDVSIARSARHALEWNVMIPEEKIQVMVEDGIVNLSGEVLYNYQRELSTSAVRDLQGVKNVINKVQIKPFINPQDIESKILKEFECNAHIDSARVSVVVEGSKVVLQGIVRSWAEQKEASKVVWSIPGVTHVENLIDIY